jgi:hypothetical protein
MKLGEQPSLNLPPAGFLLVYQPLGHGALRRTSDLPIAEGPQRKNLPPSLCRGKGAEPAGVRGNHRALIRKDQRAGR